MKYAPVPVLDEEWDRCYTFSSINLERKIAMSQIFEAGMVICFGLSWPISVYKSWKSRTAKGKSLLFEVFIWIGYVSAILGKVLTPNNITYVFIFYIINICMVSADIVLYFRNKRLDAIADQKV